MVAMSRETRDLLIVGAGPSGLAVAIAADRAGLDYEVIEKGVLVNSIFHFPRAMTFFTTPDLLEIGGLPFVTPYEKPTQWEALRYYRRVADTYRLRIAFGEEVLALRARGRRLRAPHALRGAGGDASGGRGTWCSRRATTTIRTVSASPARTCRTSRTTTTSRIPGTAARS